MNDRLKALLPDAERLLTEKEAAIILGVSNHKTLANWRSQRKYADLEYVRIGRSIRYRLGALNAFKARHTVNGEHSNDKAPQ